MPPSASTHSPPAGRHQWFSIHRVLTLAGGTFTQLVRMKVFYFMALFAVAVIASSFAFADLETDGQLKLLKDVSLASMSLFSMLFAIAGTALLIPRDIEDRTLYTILCKPVPRLEYLIGKLLGMVFLIFISLVLMDLVFCVVLYLKEQLIVSQLIEVLKHRKFASQDLFEANRAAILESMEGQGLTWSLQNGVFAIFLKATVLTGVTLLVSTFASSTIFTIMSSLAVMVIGQAQSLARGVLLGEDASLAPRIIAGGISLLFPDFKSYDITDAVITGSAVPLAIMAKMTGLTCVYLVIHLMASYVLFSDKEL
jgi:ABC-2 family transporter protein